MKTSIIISNEFHRKCRTIPSESNVKLHNLIENLIYYESAFSPSISTEWMKLNPDLETQIFNVFQIILLVTKNWN